MMHRALVTMSCLIAAPGCEVRGILVEPEASLERMVEQPRYEAFAPSPLFADGRAMRPVPVGTVPHGTPVGGPLVTHGTSGESYAERVPLTLTRALLERGRSRFNISCAVCHGRLGDGVSVVADNMPLIKPRSLHLPEIRAYPPGRLFRVVREGYGVMPAYAEDLTIHDSWAVVAYVMVLQRSQHVQLTALPPLLQPEAQEALP